MRTVNLRSRNCHLTVQQSHTDCTGVPHAVGHYIAHVRSQRRTCAVFLACPVQSSLHLDNCCGAVSGAPPAPVWSMHIASPLLLIPRTEPPLIQAQRGLWGVDQGRLAGLDLAGLPRGSRGSVAGQWRQIPLPLALVRLGFRRAPGCLLPVCSPAHGCALAPVYLRCSLDARRSLVLVWHGFPLGSSREDVAAAGLRVVGPGRGRLRGRRAGSCRSVQQPGSGWCPRRRSWGARSAAR